MKRNFLREIFTDERGKYSSNRFVGIFGALSLFASLFIRTSPDAILIEAVAAIVAFALGYGVANKVWAKSKTNEEDSNQRDAV